MDPGIRFSKMRFVVNPAAGKRRGNVEDSIRKALQGSRVTYDVVRTGYRGHGTALAREAADDGVDLVVAVGGDGTLNEVGRGLLEKKETVLGLLPTGSGNAFAHALGIPRNPGKACENLFQAIVQPIDVGRIGEEFFFSTAGVALDAEVSWQCNKRSGGPRGFLPYAIFTLGAFCTYKPEDICVKLEEGLDLRVHPTILTVANTSQFGNGVMIAPGARPDDGLLDLCVIETNTLPRTLWHVRRLFTGTIDKMPGSQLIRTRGFRIVRPGPGRFQVDGEAMTGGSTLEVTVVPKAIRMAFPRNSN